jgi:hypothetical protein
MKNIILKMMRTYSQNEYIYDIIVARTVDTLTIS